jgi:hypothetical protein
VQNNEGENQMTRVQDGNSLVEKSQSWVFGGNLREVHLLTIKFWKVGNSSNFTVVDFTS